jgi:Major tropism determinant N-terminal domain
MATQIQFRRGSTAQTSTFTGALAEVTLDTSKQTLIIHDGATAGGVAEVVNTTTAQTLTNKTLTSPTFTGNMTVQNFTVSGTLAYTNAPTSSFTANSIVPKSYVDTNSIIFGI